MELTWLAYAFAEPASPERVEAALARVEAHYRQATQFELKRQGIAGERAGLVVWSEADPAHRWPMWAERGGLGVASAYLPVGFQRVVGELDPAEAAVQLALALCTDPARIREMSQNSLVMGVIDSREQTLTILNDAIGIGRLFAMDFDGGHAWSNQVGAPPIFAGVAPHADNDGWMTLAAAGFFMGELTPLSEVRRVPAATVITVDFDGSSEPAERRTDALKALVEPRRLKRLSRGVDAIVAELTSSVRSIADLWDQPPQVDLSGGRDSRVVAAAAVVSGVDVELRTSETRPSEGATARELVARLGRPIEHRLTSAGDVTATGDAFSRAVAAHFVADGLLDPLAINRPAAGPETAPEQARLSGAAGEIARDFLYKGKIYTAIRRRRLSPQQRLEEASRRQGGVGENVQPVIRLLVEECLKDARESGLKRFGLLDYFFLVERLAHRSNVSNSIGLFAVLQSPAFIRVSFDLSPNQHRKGWLHDQLVERMIPEWTGVPFSGSSIEDRTNVTQPRIWETSDATTVEEILADDGSWTEVFDAASVRESWRKVRSGEDVNPLPLERVFARVVWRAAFDEHLKVLAKSAGA